MKKYVSCIFVSVLCFCFIFTGCAKSAEVLIEELKSENPKIRGNACMALAEMQGVEAADDIAALLLDDDPEVVDAAASCLIDMGAGSVPSIIAVYKSIRPDNNEINKGEEFQNLEKIITGIFKAIGFEAAVYIIEEYNTIDSYPEQVILSEVFHYFGDDVYPPTIQMLLEGGDNLIIALQYLHTGIDDYNIDKCFLFLDETQIYTIKKNVLMLYGSYSDEVASKLSNMNLITFQDILDIYANEEDSETKKDIAEKVEFYEETNTMFMPDLLETITYQNFNTCISLLNDMGDFDIQYLVDNYQNEDAGFDMVLQIIKNLDADFLWEKLYPLLLSGDRNAAMLIGELAYPQYYERLIELTQENPEIALGVLSAALINYKIDDRMLDVLRTMEVSDELYSVLARNLPVETYSEALTYTKKGEGGGKISTLVVIHQFQEDYGGDIVVSSYTFTHVPREKWVFYSNPEADAVITIKDLVVRGGTYVFEDTGERAPGYRQGYEISLVDMRTKKVLESIVIMGDELPEEIYESDLDGNDEYYAEGPSGEALEEAVNSLIEMALSI